MSAETKANLKLLGLLASLAIALIAIAKAGAYVAVLPARVEALEAKAIKSDADHDMLQRVDERTARIERAIERLGK